MQRVRSHVRDGHRVRSYDRRGGIVTPHRIANHFREAWKRRKSDKPVAVIVGTVAVAEVGIFVLMRGSAMFLAMGAVIAMAVAAALVSASGGNGSSGRDYVSSSTHRPDAHRGKPTAHHDTDHRSSPFDRFGKGQS